MPDGSNIAFHVPQFELRIDAAKVAGLIARVSENLDDESGRRTAAKLLTRAKARWIAANIANTS